MEMKTIMIVFGTRPEVVKLASTIKELYKTLKYRIVLINSEQQKDMTNKLLDEFNTIPAYSLDIMKKSQSLSYLTSSIITELDTIIEKESPNLVIVLGDTASSFAGTLSAYHHKIPIFHIESGVRTFDKYNAYPEEGYRRMIDHISDYHTCQNRTDIDNLRQEGILNAIYTGNASLDLLVDIKNEVPKKKVLITMHRREDWGKPISDACDAIKELSLLFSDHEFVYVMHPNPILQETVIDKLGNIKNIVLKQNLGFYDFMNELKDSKLVMTDSGGLLQEALFLKKPIVYLRKNSEYTGIFDEDILIYETGKDYLDIITRASQILSLSNPTYKPITFFGDGTASKRIVKKIEEVLG